MSKPISPDEVNEIHSNGGTRDSPPGKQRSSVLLSARKNPLLFFGGLMALLVVNAMLWSLALQDYNAYSGGQRPEILDPSSPAAQVSGLLDAEIVGGPYNGFELANLRIPKEDIQHGGPSRGAIPAIIHPRFSSVQEVEFAEDAQVIGVVRDGVKRAYPLHLLVMYEIVNDNIAGNPIMVTYCPLCGTCMVFNREINGQVYTFGVSGLVYNSDLLMYDIETESLWAQLKMEAVAGEFSGTKLEWLPSEQMTWGEWKRRYPDSVVMNIGAGLNMPFTPYPNYENTDTVMFPFDKHRDELKDKEWVLGIIVDGEAKAYPFQVLSEQPDNTFRDNVGNREVEVRFDPDTRRAEVIDLTNNKEMPSVQAYWFAWQAFYPETGILTSS